MRRILLILAAGILGGGWPAAAQEPVPVPVFHEDVVVTASGARRSTSRANAKAARRTSVNPNEGSMRT
jgi:hypothetical protein